MSNDDRSEAGTAAATTAGYASGEVSERGELLDGSLQLALEGSCELDGDEWVVSMTLAWPLAESGDATLAEGDLSLDASLRSLFAVLDEGTVAVNADTGAAHVTARFNVDASDTSADDADAVGEVGSRPPDAVECHLEVAVADWRGELAFSRQATGG